MQQTEERERMKKGHKKGVNVKDILLSGRNCHNDNHGELGERTAVADSVWQLARNDCAYAPHSRGEFRLNNTSSETRHEQSQLK